MTPEAKTRVVENIAQGLYLADFCGKDGIPTARTIQTHLLSDTEFFAQCARAREVSAELNERRIAQIVESTLADEIKPDAARVAINGLTWLAKVRAPRVYGEKVEVSGPGGGPLVILKDMTGRPE